MACNCMGQCPDCGRCYCVCGCAKGLDPTFAHQIFGNAIGWTCPACGKGNAPDVKGCVHCALPSAQPVPLKGAVR